MSAPRDLDRDLELERRVSAFLDEGPNRASERPIEAALAHARTHPRRRDPLRAFRRDPMARPWFGASAVGRSLVLVAALAALLVVSIAVATVGGLRTEPSMVPAVPTASPSASPSPSANPSPTPATLRVDLVETSGADASIDILDRSATLVGAVSGEPADGASVPVGSVVVAPVAGDPRGVRLTWTGLPCETLHELTIDPDGRTMRLIQPVCEGDAIGRDLTLILTFANAVDHADVSISIEPASSTGE